MTTTKKILIVRTDKIGDVVLTLPLAGILKNKLPGCKITFMVKEYTKPLVEANTQVDDVLIYDEEFGFDNTLKEIKDKNFDTCFVVHPRFRLALLLKLAGIKNRIGSGYRWYSFLFNKKIFEHRKYGTDHELHHNINLLKLIDIDTEITENNVEFNLQPDDNSIQSVEKELAIQGIQTDKPFIIIHPGSGGSAVDLPFSHFKKIVKELAHDLEYNVVITGSENEKEICDSIMAKNNAYNLAGKFTLPELIALISKAMVLVANSTGPIHIAAALGVNVVGFYPKIPASSQKRWGPYTSRKRVFEPNIDCSNCTREQCEKLNCMSSIKTTDVVQAIKDFIIS